MGEFAQNPHLKIVLLGDSGVGKTSVAFRWTTGIWQDSIQPTIGANHQRKVVHLENQDVDVYVWDTAGQEQYRALTPLYSRSSSCAIIMAAANDPSSFDSLSTWQELLFGSQASSERVPPSILAINKIDLYDEKESFFTRDEIDERYAQKFESIMYVSARTGEGIDDMFVMAADAAFKFMRQYADKDRVIVEANESRGCC
ncbi:small GTP-binding protein [Tritrichomonas foetus]|uniref:Small GTP-binding protein n=1 Tax=Tritrichomonas foetus TaxID=1144522 RepID=A0A1J4KEQ3_9EUKA|nr:small GTP-binding protein [Tritrichomonas foetus]|eukprot:OHT09490.1 small GTP-binding protein [Tritrichomonas foetus]